MTRHTPEFDQRIADWLEADPDSAPPDVMRTVTAALPSIPQSRRDLLAPWRSFAMNGSMRLASAAVIAVVAIGGLFLLLRPASGPAATSTTAPTEVATGVTGTPQPSPVVTRTAEPFPALPAPDATFDSPSYGYHIAYPQGWTAVAGKGPWPLGRNLQHGDPILDSISGVVGTVGGTSRSARIVGASIALPDGMDLAGFMAFASSGTCTPVDPLAAPLRIDGVEATITLNGCSSLSELGGNIWDVVLIAGGRGYDFTIDGWISAESVQAWLDSLRLDPQAAPAAS